MPTKATKKMWQRTWGYPESAAVVGGVVAVGLLLQVVVGQFDFYLLASPVNLYVGAAIVALCVAMGLFARHSKFVGWLAGAPMAVSLIVALLVLALIMGLTAQVDRSATILGFDSMTSNWAFVLIYLIVLISIGTLIVRRFRSFRWADFAFYLNHIGMWLLLAASALGYADMERYVMHVDEGQTQWRVYDQDSNVKELPIAIELADFDMDVYPPKLAIIDRATGDVVPKGNPDYFQIDPDARQGKLDEWNITLVEYIHSAVRSSDSTYKEVPMAGSTPAAKVTVTKNGQTLTGWVCAGNSAQVYMTLPLTAELSVVMTAAEPRWFGSQIEVYTQSGQNLQALLEVNKPLSVGAWTIYQYGYDNQAGRMSSYSSFELVYDPWMIPVYVGMLMMMHAMGIMIYRGRNTKEVNDDVE